MKTMRGIVFTFIFILLALLPACASRELDANDAVSVQLNWVHYGAFGGFYAADQNGMYATEGIEVAFHEGGPGIDPIAAVVDGEAQFGVSSADTLLLARAQGQPVRAIGTILRRSPAVLVTRADSGLTRPEDLIGQQVRMTSQIAPSFHAMMARAGIPPERYTEVLLPSDLTIFAENQVPVWGVYFNSFAVAIQRAGYDLNFIFPGDYGVHFYGDTLFTTEDVLAKDPALVTRFLRATLGGWREAVGNAEASGALVAAYDGDADLELAGAKMEASVPLIHTGEDQIGWMRPERWRDMYDTLLQQGLLSAPFDVTDVYTMEHLQTIYGEQP